MPRFPAPTRSAHWPASRDGDHKMADCQQIPERRTGAIRRTSIRVVRGREAHRAQPCVRSRRRAMQSWNSVVNISVRAGVAGGIEPADLRLANPGLVDPIHAGARPPVKVPNLWVEKGVIWQLPNLLAGFTTYSAATHFFSSVKSLGYSPGGVGSYQGPFSAMDFPLLWVGSSSDAYKTIHDNVYWAGINCY